MKICAKLAQKRSFLDQKWPFFGHFLPQNRILSKIIKIRMVESVLCVENNRKEYFNDMKVACINRRTYLKCT